MHDLVIITKQNTFGGKMETMHISNEAARKNSYLLNNSFVVSNLVLCRNRLPYKSSYKISK